MKSSFGLTLIITVVLAVLGYFVLSSLSIQISPAIALVIGMLFGALLVPVLVQLASGNATTTDDTSSSGSLKTLYVGNLPYRANEAAIMELFSQYGQVNSVRLMKDRRTGKRKGYGFVEIASSSAKKAINSLNDSEFQERTLKVRMAKEKTDDE
ncbi:RNA recognition motif domain-containing protein [Neptunicella sp. SCSIO 80796]|uniref:RNA recognition motif domain-containing protein n=1 Tax=Neptunicella plasticusilytica TaxID=3117012 RepID=UPI003A4DFE72